MTKTNYKAMTKEQLIKELERVKAIARAEYTKLRKAYEQHSNIIIILRQKLAAKANELIQDFIKYLSDNGQA